MIPRRSMACFAALLLALSFCIIPASAGAEGKVNINAASVEELQELKGVGPVLAERIVEYRQEHPFQSPAEIQEVKGIGPETYEDIKESIAIE